MPYIQFLRELLSKKGDLKGGSVIPIREVCSLASQSPSKLQNSGSFSISCAVGDLHIKGTLYDLGASVGIMSSLFYRKFQLQDLQPTDLVIQLTDRSIKQPMGILEDILVHVGKFIISCDFIVLDMDENFQAPLVLGRPFLTTAEAVIDVQAGTMFIQLCGKRVDFCFPQPTPSPLPATPSPPICTLYLPMLLLGQQFLIVVVLPVRL